MKSRDIEDTTLAYKRIVREMEDTFEDPVKLRLLLEQEHSIKYEDPVDSIEFKELKSVNDELKAEIMEKEREMQVLKWSKHAISEKIGDLEKRIETLENENNNIKFEAENSKKEKEKLKDDIIMLKIDLGDKTKEYDSVCEKMDQLKTREAFRQQLMPISNQPDLQNQVHNELNRLHFNLLNMTQRYEAMRCERDNLIVQFGSNLK